MFERFFEPFFELTALIQRQPESRVSVGTAHQLKKDFPALVDDLLELFPVARLSSCLKSLDLLKLSFEIVFVACFNLV